MTFPKNLTELAVFYSLDLEEIISFLKQGGVVIEHKCLAMAGVEDGIQFNEILLDYFFENLMFLRKGDIVFHEKYGKGEILEILERPHSARILFFENGTKIISLTVGRFLLPATINLKERPNEKRLFPPTIFNFEERAKYLNSKIPEVISINEAIGVSDQIKLFANSTSSYFLMAPNGKEKVDLLNSLEKYLGEKALVLVTSKEESYLTGRQTVQSLFNLPENEILAYSRLESIAVYLYRTHSLLIESRFIIIDDVQVLSHYVLESISVILKIMNQLEQIHNAESLFGNSQRSTAFARKQIFFISDVYQVPYRIGRFSNASGSFFWNAFSFKSMDLKSIQISSYTNRNSFNKEVLIRLKKMIAERYISQEDLDVFNQQVSNSPPDLDYTIVCSKLKLVRNINEDCLNRLPGNAEIFMADVFGDISPEDFPQSAELRLKVGARVLFTRNNDLGLYQYGIRGEIISINKQKRTLIVKKENSENIEVGYVSLLFNDSNNFKGGINKGQNCFNHFPLVLDYAHEISNIKNLSLKKCYFEIGSESLALENLYLLLNICDFKHFKISRELVMGDVYVNNMAIDFYNSVQFAQVKFDIDELKNTFEKYRYFLTTGMTISDISIKNYCSESSIYSVFWENLLELNADEVDKLFVVDRDVEVQVVEIFGNLNLSPVEPLFQDYFNQFNLNYYQIYFIGYSNGFLYHPKSQEFALFVSEQKKFKVFFTSNRDFAKTYISMYYSFEYEYLIENWNSLEVGKAFYSDYRDEYVRNEYYSGPELEFFQSELGLSFNKNIRWNSKLRAKYDCGFIREVEGQSVLEGVNAPESVVNWELSHKLFSIQDREYLDEMIPLSIEVEFLNSRLILEEFQARVQQWNDQDYNDYFRLHYDYRFSFFHENLDIPPREKLKEIIHTPYPRLSFSVFKYMIETTPLTILANSSIYENTIKNYLDFDFVDKFLRNAESADSNDFNYF